MKQKDRWKCRLRTIIVLAACVCLISIFPKKTHAQLYNVTHAPQLGCTVNGSYIQSAPTGYRVRMYNHVDPATGEQTGKLKLEERRSTDMPSNMFEGSGVNRIMRVRNGLEFVQDIPFSPGCNRYYAEMYLTNTSMLPPPGETDSLVVLTYRTHDCNGNPTGVQVGGSGYYFMGYYIVTNNMSMGIIAPAQGSTWDAGNAYWITWDSHSIDRVHIDLYKAGQHLRRIATNIVNTSGYSWSVPSDLYTGDDYQIRITNTGYGSLSKTSSMFRISGQTPQSIPSLVWRTSTVLPNPLQKDQSASIGVQVQNIGTGAYTKNVYMSFSSPSAGTQILTTATGRIEPGAWKLLQYNGVITQPIGSYTLLVACDHETGSGLRELYRQSITIQQPPPKVYDMRVNSLSIAPTALEKGQAGGFATGVTNTGTKAVTAYMSLHDANGVYITDLASKTLMAGSTQTLSMLTYKITSNPGTYRVVVKYYDPVQGRYVHVQEKEVKVLASKVLVPTPPVSIVQGVDEYLFGYVNFQEGIDPKTLRITATVTFQDNSSTMVPIVLENGGALVNLEGESNELLDKSLTSKFSLRVPAVAWSKKTMRMATFQIMNRYNQTYRFVSTSTSIVIKKLSEVTKECGDKYGIPPELLIGIYNAERKNASKLEGAVGPMNTMIDLLVDGGLDEVAVALRDGSTSFTGWSEYQGLTLDKMKELMKSDALTGIRAAAWSLRYVAHRMFPDQMHYNLLKNNQQDVNYPQQCLESWWGVVARYGKPQVIDYNDRLTTTKTCMISNYVYRVYKCLMDKGIKITLPPHFYLLKATTEEIVNREVLQGDYGLPHTAPMESNWMRVTVPFLPGRDMGVLHTNDGKTFTVAEPLIEGKPFRLYFPLAGKHHDTHQINAFYDYTTPGVHLAGSVKSDPFYLNDGFVMIYNGNYGMQGCNKDIECLASCTQVGEFFLHGKRRTCYDYEGHCAYDYQGRVSGDDKANWWIQYPTFPGTVRIGTASGTYAIYHGNGYRTVYVHAQCKNSKYPAGSKITWNGMDSMFVKTGDEGVPGAPHSHIEIQRCLSNNPNDWFSVESSMWVPIDPYGWKGTVVPTNWTRARYSRLWANLPSSGRQSLVGNPISLYGGCDGTIYKREGQEESLEVSALSVYPNPAAQEVIIHITSTQPTPVAIVNSLGVVVGRYTVQGSLAISVADMPVGVYVVQAVVDRKNLYKKLVITR